MRLKVLRSIGVNNRRFTKANNMEDRAEHLAFKHRQVFDFVNRRGDKSAMGAAIRQWQVNHLTCNLPH